MEYRISEVKHFSDQTYGRDSNHRALVRFEGQDKDYSAFVKERPQVGQVWDGEIKKAEKNDKIYYNFDFARTGKKPATSKAPPEILDILKHIAESQLLIMEHLQIKTGKDYPQMNETNDSSGLDDSNGIPF